MKNIFTLLILSVCFLCANISGRAQNKFSDMDDFENALQTWLQQFLKVPHILPDSDTFQRVFELLNPAVLTECLYD